MGEAEYGHCQVGLRNHIPWAVGVSTQIQAESYVPSAPPMYDMDREYDDEPICHKTGGMFLAAAKNRQKSFFGRSGACA